ncbi:MAG: transketolase family protein [Bacteroidales bacterium]|nr:transketolase family protein [Bacteroidales bacterium]
MNGYSNKGYIATREGFGKGVLKAAETNERIVVLGADITGSVGLGPFREKYPDRFISLGIAEQNCMGVAAGLALGNMVPVFSTYAVFSALRATDQVRVSVCYNHLHVVIGGAHAGISVGPDGATHQALEDIAVMRVMPDMTVLSPCDATQTKLLTLKAIEDLKGPVYIRYGREAVPDFTPENQELLIGKGQMIKEGRDISILATGHMVWEALQAAYQLQEDGINARVINIHTIKPIDQEIIIRAARETKAILTVEEHQIMGGFGSAVAEVTAKYHPVPVIMTGMEDRFGESGKPEELMDKYGLNSENIIKKARELLSLKNDPH